MAKRLPTRRARAALLPLQLAPSSSASSPPASTVQLVHTLTHTHGPCRCHCSYHGYQLTTHTQARARSHSHHAGVAPGIPTLLPHPHPTRSPARLLLAQAAAAAAAAATTALLCCGATALSVIQGTAQPHPSSPTSAQPSLSSSPFIIHTPSKEEGKHRTEGGGRQSLLFSPLGPLAPPSSFSDHQLPYPKGTPQELRRLTPLPCPKA